MDSLVNWLLHLIIIKQPWLAIHMIAGAAMYADRIRKCLFLFASGLFLGCTSAAHAQTCPATPVPTITPPQLPGDVCIPQGFGGNPIQYFDDFSWRSFIAVVWPAARAHRGQPDTSKTINAGSPLTFETFKANWEIFHNDASAPEIWNVYDAPAFNACNATASFGDVILSSFSKFSDLGQAGFNGLVGPLVAQNGAYVRYATGFNETEFNQILSGALYLRKNLPMTGAFQNGSLDVKSAWMLMTNVAHPERYYTRTALVLDPQSGNCTPTLVGLVGLHIVQKTPTRPQWIWSTFEQVDNVPPAQAGAPGNFNFNNGTDVPPMPRSNPISLDPLQLPPPTPFNVDRLTTAPINPSTVNTNTAYRALLRGQNSVWQNYQLVMTQWPVPSSQPGLSGAPANTFPGNNPTSAFANVTMETFDQGAIRNGCMNCHDSTRLQTDFVWTLNNHASPTNVPNFIFGPAFRNLQVLLAPAGN